MTKKCSVYRCTTDYCTIASSNIPLLSFVLGSSSHRVQWPQQLLISQSISAVMHRSVFHVTCKIKSPRINYLKFVSSSISSDILHRDVFICDSSFSMARWNEVHRKSLSTKHPSSGHVVAEYSLYVHNHSTYNFNNLGEFSLIFTSAIPLSHEDSVLSQSGSTILPKTIDKTHSVLIHPDGLFISGLKTAEIPTIVNLILKNEIIDAAKIRKLVPDCCKVEKLPTLVISSSNKKCSLETATQVLNWFRAEINMKTTQSAECPPLLLLASEMGGHRNSSTVLILPSEDSFEFVSSQESAKSILANCRIGT
jgi:hypothetical protein